MKKISFVFTVCVLSFLFSCSKKTTPAKEPVTAAPVKKIKTATPKVITVNDAAAKKTVDGRLYYDLEGHRYWKNYKDGKYYLYNKSMHSDDAFKAP
ncbi:hypothetical protein [Ferruginibacter sp. HRS2-29]|uniref:hypothetical protein n=1 Tax=Ferruginibacter sp. HRS2-29 TaxID=2487334 RepID=UPI0020CC7A70|nr:hypothetical protein [Ferruginibacter sp. HRS2-29]MCP9750640.1 hypothetical protein [Ferruginibacter sp. HRS2-29]